MNDRLPAGRHPVGTAETELVTAHRPLVDELRRMAGGLRPPYESSSAFSFAFDATSGRDAADMSAAAFRITAGLTSAFEQPLFTPDGPEPGPVQPTSPTPAGPAEQSAETEEPPVTAERPAETTTQPASGENGAPPTEEPALPSTEALLSQPTAVTSRELAERATRALEKGWYRDAERLFIAATEANQTDPYSWYGAGLAAKDRNERQAAAYFMRAARYLQEDDPAGSAYAALVATELLESTGRVETAQKVLRTYADQQDGPCPAVSLHLARLERDRAAELLEKAITADPMMEADVIAVDPNAGQNAIRARREATEREMKRLEDAILGLRRVGGIPPNPLAAPDRVAEPSDRLSLAWAEINLWQRIEQCEADIDDARRRFEDRQYRREEAEDIEAKQARIAAGDLLSTATLPFFVFSLAIAAAVLATYGVGRWVAAASPRFAAPISLGMWFVILCLLVLGCYTFAGVWQPAREIALARTAKAELPVHEFLVAQRRYDEIEVRRSYRNASQQAELVIQRTIGRRTAIVPRRPQFLAGDLPVVPARP